MVRRPSVLGIRTLLLAGLAVAAVVAMFTVSPPDLAVTVIVLVLLALPLALSIAALLDAAHRPAWVWALAGRERVLWMALILFGALVLPLGLVVSSWYLLRIRPVLRDTESGRLRQP